MWKIEKTIKKGEYDYALIKDHHNATKNGYVLLHRAIMENRIGRLLTSEEEIHHKNKNSHDNRIDNLELLTKEEHRRLHADERKRKYAVIKCPICMSTKEIPENQLAIHKGCKYNFCSRECRIYFLKNKDTLTDEQKEILLNNVLKVYRK